MSTRYKLTEGSVLTVAALETLVRAEQVQDATIYAMIAGGASQTFGPYPVDRDFLITGVATISSAEAVLGGNSLAVMAITADAAISRLHASAMLQVNKGTNVTLTLPANLPQGFGFLVDQLGVGLAIFACASGATKVNRQSFDRTAGAGALMSAYVRSNTDGASAVWVLGGDGAVA